MKQAPKPLLGLFTLLLALFVGVAMARTTTQNDQSDQSSQSQAGAQEHHMTVTGCLEKTADGSGYQLTDNETQKMYKLAPPSDMDLSAHVGHTVKVTGEPEAAAAGQPAGQGMETMKVSKVTHVSDTCAPPKSQ